MNFKKGEIFEDDLDLVLVLGKDVVEQRQITFGAIGTLKIVVDDDLDLGVSRAAHGAIVGRKWIFAEINLVDLRQRLAIFRQQKGIGTSVPLAHQRHDNLIITGKLAGGALANFHGDLAGNSEARSQILFDALLQHRIVDGRRGGWGRAGSGWGCVAARRALCQQRHRGQANNNG